MPSPLHSAQTAADGIHVIQAFEYANAAARTGAVGITSSDVGKVARQTDNNTFWLLTDDSPLTWAPMQATGSVDSSRLITAGNGLTGGGDLTADRTLHVGADPDGSISVTADAIGVGVLANDTQHGVRGGGSTHALVIASGAAGFMSGIDKAKLDGIATGAAALTSTPPANVTKSAASAGAGSTAARVDHKHDISTAAPVSIGSANAEGSSTDLARADHVHKGQLLQTVMNDLAVDTTTTSTSFVTLISQAITVQSGSNLIIRFSAGVSNSSANQTGFIRLQVDAVTQRGVGVRLGSAGEPQSTGLVYKVSGLSAGAHTITIQWRTSGGTIRSRPIAVPDAEHAVLLLEEVTV